MMSSSSSTLMSHSMMSSTSMMHQEETTKTTNETVLQGQKFNITNGLKKTSNHNSSEEIRCRSRQLSGQQSRTLRSTNTANGNVVGCALQGLDAALESLAKEQKTNNKYQSKPIKVTENGDGVTSVTVSLPSSKRTSRRGSIDLGQGPKQRSRRNSIDLYTADYNIKLANENHQMKMIQKSSSHIKVDDMANSKLRFCPRCHSPHHTVSECTEFGDLKCPRCLEWEHWEDSCWTNDDPDDLAQCETCLEYGHVKCVHEAFDFRQRRAIVDTLGWQPFQSWFYENSFRSWWQLNGLVGVPLYRIYKRKSDWKSGGPIEPATEPDGVNGKSADSNALSIVEKAAALAEKYSTQYTLRRDDSTDELLKSVHAQREARKKQMVAAANRQNNNDDDSGRSTPEHLKKYSGSLGLDANGSANTNSGSEKRLRTFSETLKMLDDDILEELDVK